ncbi:hypothetical protein [Flavobacterium soli]|uniref:hypothetical protein n=1 Tax=Flavobacterium soli TaxID=344881 RepID=UPI000411A130|nr:hypothetical protein [Flavobacterium soli]
MFCITITFFFGCEKEDSVILNNEKSNVRTVSLKDILGINESINAKKSSSAKNSNAYIFDNIIADGIIEIEKEDGTKTYTLLKQQ